MSRQPQGPSKETADLIETVRALEAAVSERDHIIAALPSSSSWRNTRSLRFATRLVSSPRRTLRDVAVLTLRWALTKPMLRRPGAIVAARLPHALKRRVKRVAVGAPPAVALPRSEAAASISLSDLNPGARTVYSKLKRAIAAKDDR